MATMLNPTPTGADPPPAAPSVEDPVVRFASEVAGGPFGRHAGGPRPRRVVSAVTVLVAAGTVTMAVAVLLRQHCRTTLWASPDQFTHACYSDLPALFVGAGLGQGLVPYLDPVDGAYLAQPVGTGGLLWLLGALAPGGAEELRWFFDVAALLVVVSLAVTVACVARLAGPRPWDAALVAMSPVLVTSSLVSVDLAAVALACTGMLALARLRPVTAGVLLGLAVSVRPLALVVVVAVGLLAVRTGAGGPWWRFAGGAAGTWAVVNVPVLLMSPAGWASYARAAWEGTVGYGSLLLLPQLASAELGDGRMPWSPPGWLSFAGLAVVTAVAIALVAASPEVRRRYLPAMSPGVVLTATAVVLTPVVVVAGGPPALLALSRVTVSPAVARPVWVALSVLVVLGVTVFVLAAPRRPRLPVVVLLLLVGLLVVSQSVPVQAALWVLPFAALAVPSWRLLLAWAAVEAAYTTGTWLYVYWLTVPDRGLPPWAYAVLLVARTAALLALAWRAAEISLHPEEDPVRAAPGRTDPDDPAGGPFRDAPDALVVAFR